VTTLAAGLRATGITAPCVFDGAIKGERFRAYIEQILAPTLRPNDIVMLDNLTSHKAAGVAEAIAAPGAQLVYLPPYSPDLNPIE
jgi:transposase